MARQELKNPLAKLAVNGRIDGPLVAKVAEVDIGIGARVRTFTYDGALPGPTWDLRPGQTIAVELKNELPAVGAHGEVAHPESATATASYGSTIDLAMNRPHGWTNTNLHTHGLHVSPSDTESGAGDDVFLVLEPGKSQRYDIKVPEDHTGGFFWYHPHLHGGVKQALRGGMAGAIIIRGEIDEVPEVAAAAEKLLVLQDVELSKDFVLQDPTPDDPNGNYWPDDQEFWIVNGQYRPIITMRPGEVQRWRIVNAAASWVAHLSLAGHQLHALAWDGYTLAEVDAIDEADVVPGGRLEVLVRAGGLGEYDLELLPASQIPVVAPTNNPTAEPGASTLPRVVATVRVEGEPISPEMPLPTKLPAYDPKIRPISKRRSVSYEAVFGPAPGNAFLALGVDHIPFNPEAPPYEMRVGTAEEWLVEDMDDGFTHIFHIHINPFLVTEVNGIPLSPPQWRDTYQLGPNSFRMQMNLEDFTGRYVHHCHYVDHEDMGMMEAVEVVA